MEKTYECGYCDYIGPCHHTPIFKEPFNAPVLICKRCGKSDKLLPVIIEKACMLWNNCPMPYEQNTSKCSPMKCDGWIGL